MQLSLGFNRKPALQSRLVELRDVGMHKRGRAKQKDAIDCIMGNVESCIFGAWPILGNKSQDLFWFLPFFQISLLWFPQIYGSAILKHQSSPLILQRFLEDEVMWHPDKYLQLNIYNNNDLVFFPIGDREWRFLQYSRRFSCFYLFSFFFFFLKEGEQKRWRSTLWKHFGLHVHNLV